MMRYETEDIFLIPAHRDCRVDACALFKRTVSERFRSMLSKGALC